MINFESWRTGQPDRGLEWIEVSFATPVQAAAIEVYESFNPGAVSRILVIDPQGQQVEVWSGEDPNDTCPAVLRVDFEPLDFPTIRVRVELNTALVPGFNQIDAIKLIGTPVIGAETFFEPLTAAASGMTSADPASAADYDNNGWPDVASRFWDRGDPELLHNEGNGTFGDRSRVLPDLQRGGHGGGPVLGDYDNDGDLDLFYPYGTSDAQVPNSRHEDLLLRNDRGRFVDVTQEAGLGGSVPPSGASGWITTGTDFSISTSATGTLPDNLTTTSKTSSTATTATAHLPM